LLYIEDGLHELDLGRAMLRVEDEGVGCNPTSFTMSKGLGQRIILANGISLALLAALGCLKLLQTPS
jgi:hypothetical protein